MIELELLFAKVSRLGAKLSASWLPVGHLSGAILQGCGALKARTSTIVGRLVAGPDRTTAVLCAAFVLAILGLFVFDLHVRYRDAIADAKTLTLSYAEILAEHTARTFESVDHILEEAKTVRRDAIAGRYATPRLLKEALTFLKKGSTVVTAIGWTDADGNFLIHSDENGPPKQNIADRLHFTAQRDASHDELLIFPPINSVADRLITVTSRQVTNSDGSFAGVITAIIDQEYFRSIYRSVRVGSNDTVVLATRDGFVISREPFSSAAVGRSFAGNDLFSRYLPNADSGAFESIAESDRSHRIVAFKAVPGLPLVVIVSADLRDVLAAWREHAYTFAPLVVVVLLVVLLGTFVLCRQMHRLNEKTALLNDVLACMDQGMVVVDVNGSIRVCNRRASEFLGLPEGFTDLNPHITNSPSPRDGTGELERWLADVQRRRDPSRHDEALVVHEDTLPNGTALEVRTVSLPSGGVVRTFTDITQRKAAARAVQDSEMRYRLLADNSSDVILRLDLAFVRRYVSPSSQEILGYSPEELVGSRPVDQIHPDDADRVYRTYQAVVDGVDRASVTNRIRHRDGRWIWVEAELRLVRDKESGAPSGILCSLRDVTARKAIEAEAAAAHQQAETAAEAQSQFLATMSHELRTPLNGILGFADIILDRNDLVPEVRRKIGLIQTASVSLLMVVNDILDFSKIEEGKLELVPDGFSLPALIDGVISIVSESATRKHLDLRVVTDADVPAHLIGDEGRLRQVLLNLLNNAIKFTNTGHIVLAIKHLGSDEAGARLHVSVSDTGIGIAEDKLDRLFQRFSQVDGSISREFGGTGLGLAISKRLVELMGGRIGVESAFTEGSTFWFIVTLPLATEARVLVPLRVAQAPCATSARVLLVEDVAVNQEIACSMLRAAGHQVDVVPDGSDAIMAVQAQAYDVVLMDIQMPGMDGMTATRHIRALPGLAGRVPIVAMTANVLPQQVESFSAAGMNGHLGKPFRRGDLLATVERHYEVLAAPEHVSPGPTEDAPPVVDTETFEATLAVLGNDKMNDLLGKFGAELENRLSGDAESADERARLKRGAHMLVSSAGMLGFLTLSHVCARLEAALARDGNVDVLLAEARQSSRHVIGEIATRLGQQAAA
jgi:PAS domain S-box-containing protein